MKLAFEFDAELAAQRDAVAALAEALSPGGARSFSRAAWRALGESGVLGAGSGPETGMRERAAVCEALGAAAFPGPIVETFLALDLLGTDRGASLASGEEVAALGAPPLFPFAEEATHWIALADERAFRAMPRGKIETLTSLAGDAWGRVEVSLGEEFSDMPRALARARIAAAALLCAANERALAIAAEHARTRKQFGRLIGEYQAVAHPLASAWVELNSAQRLARVAAECADATANDAEALAAAAWLCARVAALRAAEVAHQVLGAAGIVRDGPLFRFTQRIRQWASLPLAGAEARERVAASAAAEAPAPASEARSEAKPSEVNKAERGCEAPAEARSAAKPSELNLWDCDELRFRDEVREFLRDFTDLDAYLLHGPQWPRVRELFRALGTRGWLALGWPRAAGGLGRGPSAEYLLWDEVAYARAARSPLATIVARTLLRAGSEEQRARWLPPIRAGEATFALGYSEPEAGSDLAALRTRAERRGDCYVIAGEKCWQSYAGHVDHLWLLARTGEPGSRSAGLSLFIVDTNAPGLTIEPLPTLDGDALYACRFAGVEVPATRRVGPEHGAWRLMSEALADERHIQFPAGRLKRDLLEVSQWLRGLGRAANPSVRAEFGDLAARALQAEALALSVVALVQQGRDASAAAAANKLLHTELCQAIARAAFEWGGPDSLVHGARVQLLWLQSLWETIGGGTSEVMRGVVAKQVLGLAGRS